MTLFPNGHQSGMLIHAPLDAVERCMLDWGDEEIVARGTRSDAHSTALDKAWGLLGERRFSPDRALLVPIGSDWTAFFDNHEREWLAAAEHFVLCQRLGVETYFFSYMSHDAPEQTGSAHFSANRFNEGRVEERSVLLIHDGSWEFHESGAPLAFENLDAYTARRKRDRLTPDILRAYGEAIGVPYWDPSVYGTDIRLLRWGGVPPPGHETALKKLMGVLGRPSRIMDRRGVRRPPG
ncbi:MAG: hypothetical protein ACIARR_11645 [Phycisphaerales bacterium JB059]